jgi:hypothetical protein
MAGRGGARPGAGRPEGPSKATIERALIAERAVENAKGAGRKLAKEILDDFMNRFAKMAEKYQNQPKAEDKFEKWARLTVDTATRLAPFQSPTFRAVAVTVPPPARTEVDLTNVIPLDDPVAASRVYHRIVSASGGR